MKRSNSRTLPRPQNKSVRRRLISADRNGRPPRPPLELFPFHNPEDWLFIAGSFRNGGSMVVQTQDGAVEVRLGVNSFGIVGVLALRSLQTQNAGPRAPIGFHPTPDLKTELRRWAPAIDVRRLPRHIYRTRALLERAARRLELPEPRRWARLLLEHGSLGYRLSVPPKQIELYIEPPPPPRNGS